MPALRAAQLLLLQARCLSYGPPPLLLLQARRLCYGLAGPPQEPLCGKFVVNTTFVFLRSFVVNS